MILVTLTAYNMGNGATEADFDAWAKFVRENLDEALGFDIAEVDQYPFFGGPDSDSVFGATQDQREAIRGWLAVEGWGMFCDGQTSPPP